MNFLKKHYRKLIVIAISIYVVCVFVSQQKMINNYNRDIDRYEVQIAEEETKKQELTRKKDNLDSDEYVEQIAREKSGMVYPYERVYIDITK